MENKLPSIKALSSLLKTLKPTIEDDYRGDAFEDSNIPSMTVTIGWDSVTGGWSYQTGDNSYHGSAYNYPHWTAATLYRRANTRAMARDIRDQLLDLAEWQV